MSMMTLLSWTEFLNWISMNGTGINIWHGTDAGEIHLLRDSYNTMFVVCDTCKKEWEAYQVGINSEIFRELVVGSAPSNKSEVVRKLEVYYDKEGAKTYCRTRIATDEEYEVFRKKELAEALKKLK